MRKLRVFEERLGRANFATIVFAAYLALSFVQEVAARGSRKATKLSFWLLLETLLLADITLLTPLIDAGEQVVRGEAITTYGPLFPWYLLHVLGYLVAALALALRERYQAENRTIRGQLTLLGMGMLVTGGTALITNALLPYSFGDFRFCDIGTLSTLFFVLAIAYATFLHRLFGLRTLLRETLVYGLLLTFVIGTYSSTIFLVTQYLTNKAGKLTQFVVLLIAFSFDPLRRFLEKKTDHLLFGRRGAEAKGRKRRDSRQGKRAGSHSTLMLLFP